MSLTVLRRGWPGYSLFTAVMVMFIAGCDQGLAPSEGPGLTPGMGGIITFRNSWPPSDSVLDLRVAAFRIYPPENILAEILQGRAVFSDELAYDSNEQSYVIENEALNGVFEYVVVAQRYGPKLESDWRVVGVYTLTGDHSIPSIVDLQEGKFVSGVNISVDFNDLPPQPF